ncbi:MAG: desulfoferrodoxin [Blautia sp.]|nr:desulfoferrodoxin [Blautia sp.]
MKFYQCKGCGKIAILLKTSACPTKCCGEPMVEMVPGETDAALEKHVPVIERTGSSVKVTVGSVEHPMLEEHHISWIVLETNQGFSQKKLATEGKPEAMFHLAIDEEPVAAYEFCNLHGLWKAEA